MAKVINSDRFQEHARQIAGTPLAERVLELVRRIAGDPGIGREGLRAPFVRYAPVGVGAYYVNWLLCEECARALLEDRIDACEECEGDEKSVILLGLYKAF